MTEAVRACVGSLTYPERANVDDDNGLWGVCPRCHHARRLTRTGRLRWHYPRNVASLRSSL